MTYTCPITGMEIAIWIMLIIWALMIWSIIIKAVALWKSARQEQLAWFVVLIIFQTVGILEIIYLAAFQKHKRVKRKVHKKIKTVKKSKTK